MTTLILTAYIGLAVFSGFYAVWSDICEGEDDDT